MAEKKTENDENLFVGIVSPIELRRALLEASKKLVEVLKRFEAYRAKRLQKLEQIEKLKKGIAEINRMQARLKTLFPKTAVKIPKLEHIHSQKSSSLPSEGKPFKSPASEIERLEMELGEIEDKLRKLKY